MTISTPASIPGIDLSRCDREPIHIPGSIQPHGILIALRAPDGAISQVSENVARWLGQDAASVLGQPLDSLLGARQAAQIRAELLDASIERNPLYVGTVTIGGDQHGRFFEVIAHTIDGVLVLELEPTEVETPVSFQDLYPLVRTFMSKLEGLGGVMGLAQLAAAEVRRITGFDRVLIYRFNEDDSGTVLAEDRNEELPSYLDLRFPASDIPKQARELYRLNRIRLIASADYQPVPVVPPVNPDTGRPLDMSFAALRSVSPVHLEYMRNMNTAASMSISILRNGELWGLISCHHRTPRAVPFEIRTACDHLGQVLSLQIAEKEHRERSDERLRLAAHQSQLLALMASEDHFLDGLRNHPAELLRLINASGAAVLFEGACTLLGSTPSETEVRRISDWLADHEWPGLFHSDALATVMPEAAGYLDRASGVLAISISQVHRSLVIWFRPEVIQTVEWGGDPRKPVSDEDGATRLHPRRSFEVWKETVRGRSIAWSAEEIQAAQDFRSAIVNVVLRKAEELAALAADLERSNKELEAFSYSVSHDLRAPFRHIVGFAELLRESAADRLDSEENRYLRTIVESAHYAGTLVDNLLSFSQIGRASMHPTTVDMNQLVGEVRREVEADAARERIVWKIAKLPVVEADLVLLRLAVLNLVANAVKYSRNRDEAVIEIGSRQDDKETVFFVRDNGVGFDMQFSGKLFGVFQRLHRMEEFEGTGIGLANVRRIISRHGGRTWAEGAVGQGATFYFSLPKEPVEVA